MGTKRRRRRPGRPRSSPASAAPRMSESHGAEEHGVFVSRETACTLLGIRESSLRFLEKVTRIRRRSRRDAYTEEEFGLLHSIVRGGFAGKPGDPGTAFGLRSPARRRRRR